MGHTWVMEILVVLLVLVVLFFYSIPKLNAKYGNAQPQATTKKSNEPKSLGLLGVLDPKESSDLTKRGREKKPSKNWICTRCGADFILPIDPATVPIPWWYGEATKSFTNKNPAPWACPNCGTHAYTVPN